MRAVTNSVDEDHSTTFSGSQKHKGVSRPNKLSVQEKANLRTALSDYLQQADSSPEAAQAVDRLNPGSIYTIERAEAKSTDSISFWGGGTYLLSAGTCSDFLRLAVSMVRSIHKGL
jgi:hypothetical protein